MEANNRDKAIVRPSNISHYNDDYMMGGGTRLLTISNVMKIKGKKGVADVNDDYHEPQEPRHDTLPNCCLEWAFKKEVIN
ncbi:hypothetical protein MAM1_0227d08358 [Mucor ambiguus]|uniref:Uncharacterized protein n=1 Tax=Mucor ambiguus TaxID=91626 RepID=A0A0C9MDV2_9FUNG|nr:hypothetical protein MAM1_0227d08358 [Mucor ambiguus]